MSRIPKYRAYHKTEKKMYGPFTLGDLYGYEGEVNAVTLSHPYSNEGQSLVICQHRGGSPFYPQLDASSGLNPDIELMEYMEQEDRRGNEIYVSDIIAHPPHWHDGRTVSVVRTIHEFCGDDGNYGDFETEVEVIGDVYRTPHLLREGHEPHA